MFLGNQVVISRVKRDSLNPRGSMMFVGPKGVGKFTTALSTARLLMCLENGEKNCTCRSCKSIKNHPDLEVIQEEKSIKVDRVESTLDHCTIPPRIGSHRVIIIDNSDTMTQSAQNKLLKRLEEAPVFVIFILVAHNDMLPTIHSRCQQYTFSILKPKEILGYLDHCEIFDTFEREILLAASQGGIGRLKDLIEMESFTSDMKLILSELASSSESLTLQLLKAFNLHKEKTKKSEDFFLKYGEVIDSVFTTLQIYILDLKKLSIGHNQTVCFKGEMHRLKGNIPSMSQLNVAESVLLEERKKLKYNQFGKNDLFVLILSFSSALINGGNND